MSTNYSSAFPPLRTMPCHLSLKHKLQQRSQQPALYLSLAPPKYPSYLNHTLYADLALEQYDYLQNPQRNRTNSMWETLDLRLPSCWNDRDRSRNIKVGANGLDLIYTGPGLREIDAASVRANFPIRSRCGVYYYELKVISRGHDGFIGIGFCGLNNQLDRLPGWDPYSWGYHGDDGHSFAGSGTGKVFGPFFTTGDVIGCGVNFADQSVFYTKNGAMIGTAFHSLRLTLDIYPCVGLRTKGEIVTVNFGENAFAFDIVQYDQKKKLHKDITHTLSPGPPLHNTAESIKDIDTPTSSLLNHLVLSHLAHHGYGKTVNALLKNVSYTDSSPLSLSTASPTDSTWGEKDVFERQSIRSAIMAGDIDLAIRLLDTHFPDLFVGNERGRTALFQLKCQKFIEMIGKYAEKECAQYRRKERCLDLTDSIFSDDDHMSLGSNGSISAEGENEAKYKQRTTDLISTSPISLTKVFPVNAPGRRLSYAAITASSYSVLPPTIPTHSRSTHHTLSSHNSLANIPPRRRSSSSCSAFSAYSSGIKNRDILLEEGESALISQPTVDTMKQIMTYGQQLQEEYRSDERTSVKTRLVEIFSLLAYPDPTSSPVGYLLDNSGRSILATELNTAILLCQKRPGISPLEQVYRQALVTSKELAIHGHSKAVMVNVEESMCRPSPSIP
ncbi:hypothetical protein F4703DRAFT_1929086 [Phycomyces blakesleeanus]